MAEFHDVAEIRDTAGMVLAVISARARNDGSQLYSFMFLREFEDKGQLRRTSWLNDRHADAVLRLVPLALARIQALSAAGTVSP